MICAFVTWSFVLTVQNDQEIKTEEVKHLTWVTGLHTRAESLWVDTNNSPYIIIPLMVKKLFSVRRLVRNHNKNEDVSLPKPFISENIKNGAQSMNVLVEVKVGKSTCIFSQTKPSL